jgi:hypothetical protein
VWDYINTIKENTEVLIDASKESSLEVNNERTKYMLPSCHQNAGEDQNMKIDNRAFENVAEFCVLE